MTATETVRVRGRQGDWTAKVVDWAETLPCVHQCFWTNGARYHDPNPAAEDHRFAPHVALMHEKRRVIVTKDKVVPGRPRGGGYFQRDGYVAIYEIDDITVDEHGLRFRFGRRLANAR